MNKNTKAYFHLIWPLIVYIVIEIVFQKQVRNTMANFDGDTLNMLEWWGRFMFAASMGLFSFYLLGKKTLSYIIAAIAFLFAANIYTVATKVIPEDAQSNIEQNFIWSYRVGNLSNRHKIFDIMTIYKENNTQQRQLYQENHHLSYATFISDEKIHNIYQDIHKKIVIAKRSYIKSHGGFIDHEDGNTLEQMSPQKFMQFKEKANQKFADVARDIMKINYLNVPHPLGNMIPLESDEATFKKALMLWIDQEIVATQLKTKKVTTDKMKEASIMLPIALFFSSMGILLNSVIFLYYTLNTFMNNKFAALTSLGYLSSLTVVGLVAQTSIPLLFSGIIPIINVIGWV